MIEIIKVTTRRQQKLFTTFPNKLFKDVETFVPAFIPDEMNIFSKNNPVADYCDYECYLAYQDNKIVGRIAGIINHKINNMGKKQIRFTRFDAIDDFNVSKALFDAVTAWGKSQGMDTMIGPMGFTDMDLMGMLVEGFEYNNLFITVYNPPYYLEHLAKLGFVKDVDWLENRIMVPDILPAKIVRGANIARKRYGFKLANVKKKKDIKIMARAAFTVYNEALNELYGFAPLSEHAINFHINQVIGLVRSEYIWFVLDKEDNVVGFGAVMPSLAAANKKNNGKLFPFGWIRLLKALRKHKIIDMYFIAVSNLHQGKGLAAIILEDAFKVMKNNGVIWAETGPELESNRAIAAQWKEFDSLQHQRRRSFITKI